MSEPVPRLKVFLVDDESLALKRLARLLDDSGKVEILGTETDPENAVGEIILKRPELLFLDIQMPVLNGFEMLARLPFRPIVIFTTAFDRYALRAFDVNSVDYLLKPIEPKQLDRALNKVETLRQSVPRPPWQAAIEKLAAAIDKNQVHYPKRIATRVGGHNEFIELSRITHFRAENKSTLAVTATKEYPINYGITQLEKKLDPRDFVRIHRSILLNINHVQEVHSWFAGSVLIHLKDGKRTELTVTRERVRTFKERLSF